MHVKVIGCTEPRESLCEHAGRVCYQSESKGDPGKFLKARIRQGHESLIEHFSMTFEIEGISRACSHQLVRHRIASFSQESQRFVDMSNPEFVLPDSIRDEEYGYAIESWDRFMAYTGEVYRALRQFGIPKEDARYVLPNATATKIVVTMNARSLRHFFKLRCHESAQWEIRAVAKEMLRLAREYAPSLFDKI